MFRIICLLVFVSTLLVSLKAGKVPSGKRLCNRNRQDNTTSFIPKCSKDGNFVSKQCDRKLRQCWCVNITSGKDIKRTRKRQRFFKQNCDKITMTKCERKFRNGHDVQCDDQTGLYVNVKCNATICLCIHAVTGLQIPGRVNGVNESLNCSDQRSLCQIERDEDLKLPVDGGNKTRNPVVCSVNGFYMQAQCDVDYTCSCADKHTGKLFGKRYDVLMFDFLCDETTDGTETKGDCEWRKHQILRQYLPATPIPQCSLDTSFIRRQCDEEKCWCINENVGTLIRGTRTKRKMFNINCEALPEQECVVEELVNGYVILPRGEVARPGTSVSYACNSGYKVSRPFYNRCLPSLKFSKKPPVCIKLREDLPKTI